MLLSSSLNNISNFIEVKYEINGVEQYFGLYHKVGLFDSSNNYYSLPMALNGFMIPNEIDTSKYYSLDILSSPNNLRQIEVTFDSIKINQYYSYSWEFRIIDDPKTVPKSSSVIDSSMNVKTGYFLYRKVKNSPAYFSSWQFDFYEDEEEE